MKRVLLAGALMLAVAACETVPEAVELTPEEFEAALNEAESAWHPYVQIQALSETLDEAVLSDAQKARLLFERGSTRRMARIDLPGAIADFEQALALSEPGSEQAGALQTEIEYARTDLERARSQLETLQTLPEWVNSIVATGDIEAAAERYRASGLSPDETHTRLFQAADFLCEDESEDDQDFTLGSDIGHLDDLEWCENQAVT